ncbi:MAG: fructan beta-fructosidase [Verrucomicrobiota bacterium]
MTKPRKKMKLNPASKWMSLRRCGAMACLIFAAAAGIARAAAPDIVLADFEGTNYGAWQASGTAFGPGPAHGALPNQQKVAGFDGKGLVNTFLKGDNSTGSLVSPVFVVERPYLNFLVGGGNRPEEAGVQLRVDGKIVRSTTGADDEALNWVTWDLSDLMRQRARLEIFDNATGGWGHVNVDQIVLSDTRKGEIEGAPAISTGRLYDEIYRPQFHFTARSNWLNDPNGLVFYKGEYHLFFQHNPGSVNWGSMTWGHAVSPDLVHWSQLEHALWPDRLGTMFSGSAVIDWNNTAGFQSGDEKSLVCIYTAAGGTSPESKGQPFTQCIAYSNDRGRSFTKWSGNPALKNVVGDNRDPKVFWHEPTRRWVMALYVPVVDPQKKGADGKPAKTETIQFFASPDLKQWTFLSQLDGFFECPDLFELRVDGDRTNTRWVIFGANAEYLIGRFDGTKFTRESGKHKSDFGKNFYAAQTFSDIPESDGRRIIIGWMQGGKYPGMPFNQQMAFPCELTLRTTPEGLRLFKWPVKEIEKLRLHEARTDNSREGSGGFAHDTSLALPLDLEVEFEPAANGEVTFDVRGNKFTWIVPGNKLTGLERSMPLAPVNGRVKLRFLIDRSSVEIFGNDGAVVMSSCLLGKRPNARGSFRMDSGNAKIIAYHPYQLKSSWPEAR